MLEIERKFLVNTNTFEFLKQGRTHDGNNPFSFSISQLYLSNTDTHDVRIRVETGKGWALDKYLMTIKNKCLSGTRKEVNIDLNKSNAEALLAMYPAENVIEKTRYVLEGQFDQAPTEESPRCFTIDEFHGANQGLIMAEIELFAIDTPIDDLIDLFDVEVTEDARYYNSYLSEHPFTEWCHV